MIGYEAAKGAKVIVRGSAVVKDGWRQSASVGGRGGSGQAQAGRGAGGRAQVQTWDVDLDGNLFGGYNPFGMMNMPSQRWQYMNRMSINVHNILVPYTRVRGMMFVDGKPLDQVRAASEFFGRDPVGSDPADSRTPQSSSVNWAAGWASISWMRQDCRCASVCPTTTARTNT